jgi:hypothetical protein
MSPISRVHSTLCRRQQQLESEQANRPEPHRHVRIEDNSGDAAM